MKKTIFLFFTLFIAFANIKAAFVDTIVVQSKAGGIDIRVIVILPDKALGENAQNCSAVYLLHGYTGNETDWLTKNPNLSNIADEKSVIIVCPDGKNSWYLDSPTRKDSQYETFISVELVNYIDAHYPTISNRKHRAITGLSMGGHGALYNAFKHTDTFGLSAV